MRISLLVIEDEAGVRESIVGYFEDMGSVVFQAEDGTQGLELFHQKHPDAVLVDLRMPGMDGLEVVSSVKKESPDTPVIVVSGTGVLADAIEALRRGAWDYVLKPIEDMTVLEHAVNRAVERARLIQENRAYQQNLEGQVQLRTAELQRLNQTLQDREKQLDDLLANVDAIIMEGNPYDIYYLGGRVDKILGYPKEQWFQDPKGPAGFWLKHLHPRDSDKAEICAQAVARGEDHSFEYRMMAADGREVWFYDTVTVESEAGKPVKARSVMVDITERKRMEEREKEQQVQLAHVSRLSTLGEMASGLAHEVNQPLASILSHAGLCLTTIKTDPGQLRALPGYLEEIAKQAELAGQVAHRIKGFSRKQGPERSRCPINEIVQEAIGLIQWEAQRDGIEIRTRLTTSPASVHAVRVRLAQVIVNLARNALEAMQDTEAGCKELAIETRIAADGYVEVGVQDRGPGIPADMQETMFDPFCTSKSEGLGLGLAISERIIREHRGRLWLASSDSSGTTLAFQLPIVTLQPGPEASGERSVAQPTTHFSKARRESQRKRRSRGLDMKR